jgi:hypothetical protein
VTRVKNKGQESIKKFEEVKQSADDGQRANNMLFLLEDRKVWPWIVSDVNAAIDSTGAVDKDRLKDKLVSGAWDGTGEPPVPYESWSTIELLQLGGKYKFVASPTPHRTVDVTMRIVVPRDGKSAKQFVQQTVLAWLNENADRKDAPYKIIIPAAGIVPEFAPLNAAPGADGTKSSGGSSGADDVQQPETSGSDEGAGNVQGRNKSEVLITTKGGTLGGAGFGSSGGAGGADPIESGSDSGGAGQGKKDRKANRVAIKSSSAEPVDIERDAALPSAPNPYAGKPATTVTIKFTVELRPPTGRDIVPAAPGAEGEPPVEGTEGAQQ